MKELIRLTKETIERYRTTPTSFYTESLADLEKQRDNIQSRIDEIKAHQKDREDYVKLLEAELEKLVSMTEKPATLSEV